MNEITLVTAFFDIGRKDFQAIPRDNSKYFNHFKFWARMKNDLIVYTSPEFKDDIFEIRKNFNLESKTHIVVIDNIFNIEPSIFDKMSTISSNEYFKDFRFLPNATSNIAKYSYLMLLKTWFLKDATENFESSETIAWIDFGFNHGGDLYVDPNDFNFEWKYSFPSDKIQMFYYKKLDDKPIFETVKRLNDSIMGCLIVVPKTLTNTLWELNKDSMIALNKVGLIDDDQLIQLMSTREKPELFSLTESEWFLPLKTYGGNHLKTKKKIVRSRFRQFIFEIKIKNRLRKKIKAYLKVTKHNLLNKDVII